MARVKARDFKALGMRGDRIFILLTVVMTSILLLFVLYPVLSVLIIAGRRGLIYHLFKVSPHVYGWPGLIISQILTFLPLGFLMVNNVLQSMDTSLEDASSDLGAGQAKTLFKIIVPLSLPGLFKAALLVFITPLADFGNPMLIRGGSFITDSGRTMGTESRKPAPYISDPVFALSLAAGLTIFSSFFVIFLTFITRLFMINNTFTQGVPERRHLPDCAGTNFLGPSGCGKTTLLRMIVGFTTQPPAIS